MTDKLIFTKGGKDIIEGMYDAEEGAQVLQAAQTRARYDALSGANREQMLKSLEKEMQDAAKNLEFEKAAQCRDRLFKLRQELFGVEARQGNH